MRVQTAFAKNKDTKLLLDDALQQLTSSDINPSAIFAFFNTDHPLPLIQTSLTKTYDCPILLASSCLGALGSNATGHGSLNDLVVFALEDPDGHYGVGSDSISLKNPREAASSAIMAALENSGVSFESPALVWCAMPPGNEEEMLAGFADVIGPNIPVFGGSAADNDVTGQWQQGTHADIGDDRVVVAVLHTSTPIGMSYSSGYKPTKKECIATDVEGRILNQLDDKQTAIIYNQISENSNATGH